MSKAASRKTLMLALAAGAISAFAFQPVGMWPLMLLAFALLCHLLSGAETLKRAMLIGWLFGLGQFVIGLNWIATAFTYQAAMPAWLGWIAVVLLSLYLALYSMLAAALAWTFGRDRPLALLLGLAGAWAITEWLRAGMFTGFAWNPVGVTLADTHLINATTVIGTYGLSALVVLAACLPALAQRPATTPKTPPPVVDPLDQFNASVEELVKKVWPSVVQIQVSSYGPREESDRGNTNVIVGRQRSVGSGFVIDPEGYIMTNAHVVSGAQRIRYLLRHGMKRLR